MVNKVYYLTLKNFIIKFHNYFNDQSSYVSPKLKVIREALK